MLRTKRRIAMATVCLGAMVAMLNPAAAQTVVPIPTEPPPLSITNPPGAYRFLQPQIPILDGDIPIFDGEEEFGFVQWVQFDDGLGLTVNSNIQRNIGGADVAPGGLITIESAINDNDVYVDLIEQERRNGRQNGLVLVLDDMRIDLVDNELDNAATGNEASNAVVLGSGIVDATAVETYDPSVGPVIQDSDQANYFVEVIANANENDIVIDTQAATFELFGAPETTTLLDQTFPTINGQPLMPVEGGRFTLSGNMIRNAATGNLATNSFLGDISDIGTGGQIPAAKLSDPQPETLVTGFGDFSDFINANTQTNLFTRIYAEASSNFMTINPEGRYGWFDFTVSNNVIDVPAIGNDAINVVGLTTNRRSSPRVSQLNTQINEVTDIDAWIAGNTIGVEPRFADGSYEGGDITVSNNRLSARAIGNRAINRLGGPDLGGIGN